MIFKEEIERRITEFELDKFKEPILRRATLGIAVTTVAPDDYSIVGNTRFGGHPDLPVEMEYPMDDGLYQNFLCQINLLDIAHLRHDLPKEGMLYFFMIDSEIASDVNINVFYYPENRNLELYELIKGEDPVCRDDNDYRENGYTVIFKNVLSLPPDYVAPSEELELDSIQEAQYAALRSVLLGNDDCTHHLLCQENYIDEDPRKYHFESYYTDAVFLLALRFDKNTKFCFWNAGDLLFMIHKEDLENLSFDKVVASIETS